MFLCISNNFIEIKKTLVLDLDETLVHSSNYPLPGSTKISLKNKVGEAIMVNFNFFK